MINDLSLGLDLTFVIYIPSHTQRFTLFSVSGHPCLLYIIDFAFSGWVSPLACALLKLHIHLRLLLHIYSFRELTMFSFLYAHGVPMLLMSELLVSIVAQIQQTIHSSYLL